MAKVSEQEQNWQEMYYTFQALQKQIENITEHLHLLEQQMHEIDISTKAIESLHETKLKTEILSPIANGIFVKSSLQDNDTFIVNVGANTTVERNHTQVIDLLGKQKKEITIKIQEAHEILEKLQNEAVDIYQKVELL